jgi:hypothetical protein
MTMYLIAETGKPKEVLEKWREDFFEGEANISRLMKEIGAEKAFRFPFEKPVSFSFPNDEQPTGWTKPSRKGASRPKKGNKDAIEKISAIDWPETVDSLVVSELNLPFALSYENDAGKGSKRLSGGRMNVYHVCWTSNTDKTPADVILVAPDFEAEAKAEAGTITWKPEGSTPVIPEGFRQVTEAEVDLIFAEAKVARERARAAEAEAEAEAEEPSI